jgi:hypothetical protein
MAYQTKPNLLKDKNGDLLADCHYILMRWQMGVKRNVYRLLVGKPEGKRPLGRTRYRWVDNNNRI